MASLTSSPSTTKHHTPHTSISNPAQDDSPDEQRGRKRRRSSALSPPPPKIPSNQSTTLRGRGRRRSLSPSLSQSFTSTSATSQSQSQTFSRSVSPNGHKSPGRKYQKHSLSHLTEKGNFDHESGASKVGMGKVTGYWESEKKRRSQSPSRSRSAGARGNGNGNGTPRPRRRQRTRTRSRSHGRVGGERGVVKEKENIRFGGGGNGEVAVED